MDNYVINIIEDVDILEIFVQEDFDLITIIVDENGYGIVGPQGPPGPQGIPGPDPDLSDYYSKTEVDALIAIKQFIPPSNFTLSPAENSHNIGNAGYICTINPNTQTYQDIFEAIMKNLTDAIDGSIVCTAAAGWTYKVNSETTVASGTFTFPAGATCTIIKYTGTNKIYIDGGVE